jgi:uncharacterized coiled-coil protein SlyX
MPEKTADADARIDDLESRLTLADHAILELSNEVYRQQQQLTRLDAMVNRLADHIKQVDAAQASKTAVDDVPPHY